MRAPERRLAGEQWRESEGNTKFMHATHIHSIPPHPAFTIVSFPLMVGQEGNQGSKILHHHLYFFFTPLSSFLARCRPIFPIPLSMHIKTEGNLVTQAK